MPTPYQRARAAMRATHQMIALQHAAQPQGQHAAGGDTDELQEGRNHHENHQEQEQDVRSDRQRSISSNRATGEDPDMAQPIQRARKALRDAVGNGEAQRIGGSYRSDTAEADMEEGLGRPPSTRRGTYSRQGSRRYSGELFEGHMGFSPPQHKPDGEPGERMRGSVMSQRSTRETQRTTSGSERNRERWHSAVRDVVALHSMRPHQAPLSEAADGEGEGGEEEPPPPRPGWISPKSDAKAVWRLFTGSWMSLLLLAIPFGWISHFVGWGPIAVFVLNFFALLPLALVLGEVTEDLALRFGDIVGGLLNATFGNVVELILSVAALTKGLYTVVAMSLIGSILSNLLLVMGCCFLFGGTRYLEQGFSLMVNKACCSLLFIASIAIVIPTAALQFYGAQAVNQTTLANLSHAIAILLILLYLCYLLFQLKTHSQFFNESGDDSQPALSLVAALCVLTGITVVVAVCSEFLTGALNDVAEKSGLSQAFLGLIILPIAGNACEHITAVFVAVKNKMDLAIGVALGSSIQIAIFVLPVMVLVGWAINRPFLMDFEPFAALILLLAVVHTYFCSSDGSSNWLMGIELVCTYVLIALLYLFVKDVGGQPAA